MLIWGTQYKCWRTRQQITSQRRIPMSLCPSPKHIYKKYRQHRQKTEFPKVPAIIYSTYLSHLFMRRMLKQGVPCHDTMSAILPLFIIDVRACQSNIITPREHWAEIWKIKAVGGRLRIYAAWKRCVFLMSIFCYCFCPMQKCFQGNCKQGRKRDSQVHDGFQLDYV